MINILVPSSIKGTMYFSKFKWLVSKYASWIVIFLVFAIKRPIKEANSVADWLLLTSITKGNSIRENRFLIYTPPLLNDVISFIFIQLEKLLLKSSGLQYLILLYFLKLFNLKKKNLLSIVEIFCL